MIIFGSIIAIVIVLLIVISIAIYEFTFVHRMDKRFDPLVMTDSDLNYYGDFHDAMLSSSILMTKTDHKHVFIKSFDGLKLNGHLYDPFPGRPLMIFCHGYHGSYLRDGYGSFRYCMDHKINILMIEQRSHCKSEGKVISFGVNERRDACDWVKYAKDIMPEGTKIILSGVSMGAATVMMATDLLENEPSVIAFIEDCGYTSPQDIIINTAANMHLPAKATYPLCRLAAKILGHFDPNSARAIDSLKEMTKPILFIHGDNDSFVPTRMCPILFDVCASKNKKMQLIPGAKHAIAALVDYEDYEKAVSEFLKSVDAEMFSI